MTAEEALAAAVREGLALPRSDKNNQSGWLGVAVSPQCTARPYKPVLYHGSRQVPLGFFATPEEAALRRARAARHAAAGGFGTSHTPAPRPPAPPAPKEPTLHIPDDVLRLLRRADGAKLGEDPVLCESAGAYVLAHRNGRLRLELLGLMLGHFLQRPVDEVLQQLSAYAGAMAVLQRPRTAILSEAERRQRQLAEDVGECNKVLQRLLVKVEKHVEGEAVRAQKQQERERQRELAKRTVQAAKAEVKAQRHEELEVERVLQRVLTQIEREAQKDARGVAREVSALLGIMVRQVEAHVEHDQPLGATIGMPRGMIKGDDARKVTYRRSDATADEISDSAVQALADYVVSLGGRADMVAGWVVTRETRMSGNSEGTTDLYFHNGTPKAPGVKRLRSRAEVARFLGLQAAPGVRVTSSRSGVTIFRAPEDKEKEAGDKKLQEWRAGKLAKQVQEQQQLLLRNEQQHAHELQQLLQRTHQEVMQLQMSQHAEHQFYLSQGCGPWQLAALQQQHLQQTAQLQHQHQNQQLQIQQRHQQVNEWTRQRHAQEKEQMKERMEQEERRMQEERRQREEQAARARQEMADAREVRGVLDVLVLQLEREAGEVVEVVRPCEYCGKGFTGKYSSAVWTRSQHKRGCFRQLCAELAAATSGANLMVRMRMRGWPPEGGRMPEGGRAADARGLRAGLGVARAGLVVRAGLRVEHTPDGGVAVSLNLIVPRQRKSKRRFDEEEGADEERPVFPARPLGLGRGLGTSHLEGFELQLSQNESGYKNVTKAEQADSPAGTHWHASVMVQGQRHHIGYYEKPERAALAVAKFRAGVAADHREREDDGDEDRQGRTPADLVPYRQAKQPRLEPPKAAVADALDGELLLEERPAAAPHGGGGADEGIYVMMRGGVKLPVSSELELPFPVYLDPRLFQPGFRPPKPGAGAGAGAGPSAAGEAKLAQQPDDGGGAKATYVCPVESCRKAYTSAGCLYQHKRRKHPELVKRHTNSQAPSGGLRVGAGAVVLLKRTPDKSGWASKQLTVQVQRVHPNGTFDALPRKESLSERPWRLDGEPLSNIERVLSASAASPDPPPPGAEPAVATSDHAALGEPRAESPVVTVVAELDGDDSDGIEEEEDRGAELAALEAFVESSPVKAPSPAPEAAASGSTKPKAKRPRASGGKPALKLPKPPKPPNRAGLQWEGVSCQLRGAGRCFSSAIAQGMPVEAQFGVDDEEAWWGASVLKVHTQGAHAGMFDVVRRRR